MKILVVDDSRVMRQIIMRTLRQAGFDVTQVVEASDGLEGLSLFHHLRPDLVLSDWNMPEVSGLEMLDAVRRSGSDVLFGLVTSEGSPEMREKAVSAGASFLVPKPFTVDAFEAVIRSALEAGAA